MAQLDEQTIRNFLTKKIELWNDAKADELEALYREIAPQGLVFEFVGAPAINDGYKALRKMCTDWGGHIAIELVEVLVNGNEVACYVKNHRLAEPGSFVPSIETYTFADGKLVERYFHNSPTAEAFVAEVNRLD
ncbi:MAG: hypothetical protein CMK32_03145 [Porticoccaceae bacterium]|nr:hypothetical protein [Porticoccaceae bacterium]